MGIEHLYRLNKGVFLGIAFLAFGSHWADAAPQGRSIPLDEMSIVSCDSAEMEAEKTPPTQAIDGRLDTEWISQWKSAQPGFPHQIVLKFKTPRTLSGLRLVKRATGENAPGNFEVLYSNDAEMWAPLFTGTMSPERINDFSFDAEGKARFMRIIFHSSEDGSKHIALSEIAPFTSDIIPYSLDISKKEEHSTEPWIKGGGKNPQGESLGVNALHWIRGEKPWTPVMGEFHFIRYPQELWEEELRKMKAGGVSIVSTYIFWEYTEFPQGTWDWTGNKNLRHFVELCQKVGLYVWVRPGPYINAEARNGGLPSWVDKEGKRSDAPQYIKEVKSYFKQVGEQLKGLYYKDGGPIIGCQLENEYAHGHKDHLSTLKQIALEAGIDVPFYSSTANSEYHYEKGDIIPFQGAYPYRFWETPKPTSDFLYTNDEWGAMENLGRLYYDMKKFPRALCELGGGCLNSHEWRFIVPPYAMEGSTQNVLGRGVNLVGYYMYQGGSQPQEWGLRGGCPQNYDYQAPLGEFGQRRPSYHALKLLHHFMNDFGDLLGPTLPVRPASPVIDPSDSSRLRYIGRFQGERGFLFMNTCQPWVEMQDLAKVQFHLAQGDKQIKVPLRPIKIPKNIAPIFSINLDLNGINLVYSTAQLMAKVEDGGIPCYVFFTHDRVRPDFCFATGTQVETNAIEEESGELTCYYPEPSREILMTLSDEKGPKAKIILLSREDAERSWRMKLAGQERLLISSADIMPTEKGLDLMSYQHQMSLSIFPSCQENILDCAPEPEGAFSLYTFDTPEAEIKLEGSSLPAKSWTFTLPPLPKNVRDILIQVHYSGSSADLMMGDKRYTDHRHIGLPFEFSLQRFALWKTDKLSVTAQPWDEKVQGIPTHFAPASDMEKNGMIRSVDAFPEYVISLPFL